MATVTITNSTLDFDHSSRKLFLTYVVEMEGSELYKSINVVSDRQWCNVKNKTITVYQTEIELATNNSFDERQAAITITVTTSSGTYTKTTNISQRGYTIYPIWETRKVKIPTQLNSVNYYVNHNGNKIYSGKAYTLPNNDYVEIDMSRICSSFLNSSLEGKIDKPKNYIPLEGVGSFNLYVNDNLEGAFPFVNSYSYKKNPDTVTASNLETMMVLSDPIRKLYDSRQYIMYSFFSVLSSGGYNNTFTLFSRNMRQPITESLSGRTQYVTMIEAPNADKIEFFNGETFPIKKTCCKYCLYYKNAWGGWDSFLINGNDKRTDKITTHKFIKAADNTTREFGTKTYLNVIQPSYKLYTDYLTDDESSRMHHLLESTEVYMHNLEDGEIVPVNLTNSTCEFKTYTNNGKKMFYYEINAEYAQLRVRE